MLAHCQVQVKVLLNAYGFCICQPSDLAGSALNPQSRLSRRGKVGIMPRYTITKSGDNLPLEVSLDVSNEVVFLNLRMPGTSSIQHIAALTSKGELKTYVLEDYWAHFAGIQRDEQGKIQIV